MTDGRLAREHPELLARLLEGDLKEWEHSKLLAEFADDPESIAILLDAESALREVGGLAVVHEAPRRPSRAPLIAMAGLAVATAAALVVVGPFGVASAPSNAPLRGGPSGDRAALSPSNALPDGWHVAGLPLLRGGLQGAEQALAVRVGALATTLDVAMSRGDAQAATETLRTIAQALEPIRGTGPARALLADLEVAVASGTVSPQDHTALMAALEARFRGTVYSAGQTAEHARIVRLAGGTPDAGKWLASQPSSEPMLQELGALLGLGPDAVVGSATDFRDFLIQYATASAWDR